MRLISYSLMALAFGTKYVIGQSEYQYVIAGSGAGGGPLAVEIAKAGYSVLLLEAGSDLSEDPLYQDPDKATEASNDPRTRWDFFVKHSNDSERELKYEHTTWRTTNGSLYVGLDTPREAQHLGVWYPRAATLGGCAMHNAAILHMPSDDIWNYIANITGDDSWKASEMRKVYEEIENCNYLPKGSAGHGFSGWLQTNQNDGSWLNNATDGDTVLKATAELTGSTGNNTGSEISDAELKALLNRDINGVEPNRDQMTGVFAMATIAAKCGFVE